MIRLFALAYVAAATVDTERQLPMPAWAFGIIAIGVFASLLAVVYSFRSVGTKHGDSQSPGS